MKIQTETRYAPMDMNGSDLQDIVQTIENVFEDQRGYPTDIEVVDLPQGVNWSKNNLAINHSKVTFFRWAYLRNYIREYGSRNFLNIRDSGWTIDEINDINSLLEGCFSRLIDNGLGEVAENYKYHLVHWYNFTRAVIGGNYE